MLLLMRVYVFDKIQNKLKEFVLLIYRSIIHKIWWYRIKLMYMCEIFKLRRWRSCYVILVCRVRRMHTTSLAAGCNLRSSCLLVCYWFLLVNYAMGHCNIWQSMNVLFMSSITTLPAYITTFPRDLHNHNGLRLNARRRLLLINNNQL